MGLLDKVKETAQKGADLAKDGVKAGQDKLDEQKLKKKVGDLKEELGGLVYGLVVGLVGGLAVGLAVVSGLAFSGTAIGRMAGIRSTALARSTPGVITVDRNWCSVRKDVYSKEHVAGEAWTSSKVVSQSEQDRARLRPQW